MKNHVATLSVVFLALAIAGCGGSAGGGGNIDPPPAPNIVISLTCASSTVNVGGTTQCSATTTPIGSGVSYSASAGTISSSGLYAAPAAIESSSETVTIMATATANSSATATAKVTVNGGITIAPISPYIYWPPAHNGFQGFPVQATGLVTGDQVVITPTALSSWLLQNAAITEGGMSLLLGFGSESTSPGWIGISAKSADDSMVSNTVNTVLTSAGNILTVCPDRIVISDEADGLPDGQNGIVREYGFDGKAISSFLVGHQVSTIQCDSVSGDIVTNFGSFNASGVEVGLLGNVSGGDNGYPPPEIASGSGDFCELMYKGVSACGTPVTNFWPSFTSVSTGTGLSSIAMSPASNMAQVYANGSNELWWIQAPDATVLGHVSLSGVLTPQSAIPQGTPVGGWPGVVFGSGNRAGYSALLSIPDEKLVIALGEAVTSTIDLKPIAPANSTPIMIVADEPMGTIIVGFADDAAKVGRFISIDPLTGAVTAIAATSISAPVGMGVSADGKTLYVGSRDAAPDILTVQ